METLDLPLPNPSYRQPRIPAEDPWASESWDSTPTPRTPNVSGYGPLSSEIPTPTEEANDWVSSSGAEGDTPPPGVPRTPGSHTPAPNTIDDEWEDSWAPPSTPKAPPAPATTNASDWDEGDWGDGPKDPRLASTGQKKVRVGFGRGPDSVLSLTSPAFSLLSSSKPQTQFYTQDVGITDTADDGWNESPAADPPVIRVRDPADSKLRKTESGKDFPLLMDDESVELVRDELGGRDLLPLEWSVEDVKDFVKGNGFRVQAVDLAKQKVNGDRMMALTTQAQLSELRGFQCARALAVSKLFWRLRCLCRPPRSNNDEFQSRGRGGGRGGGGGGDGGRACYKCNQSGHMARDCTEVDLTGGNSEDGGAGRGRGRGRGGGRGGGGGSGNCFKCDQPGHISRDCPDGGGGGRGGGSGNCFKCDQPGHISRDCPDGGGGGRGRGGGSGNCFKCDQPGHISRDCPDGGGGGRGRGGGGGNCFKCDQPGHISRDCPDGGGGRGRGRGRGGSNSSGSCYKCGKPGHISRDCTESGPGPGGRRGYNSTDGGSASQEDDDWGTPKPKPQAPTSYPEDDDWGAPSTFVKATPRVSTDDWGSSGTANNGINNSKTTDDDDWDTGSTFSKATPRVGNDEWRSTSKGADKSRNTTTDDDEWDKGSTFGGATPNAEAQRKRNNDSWDAGSSVSQTKPTKISRVEEAPAPDDDDEWA